MCVCVVFFNQPAEVSANIVEENRVFKVTAYISSACWLLSAL